MNTADSIHSLANADMVNFDKNPKRYLAKLAIDMAYVDLVYYNHDKRAFTTRSGDKY